MTPSRDPLYLIGLHTANYSSSNPYGLHGDWAGPDGVGWLEAKMKEAADTYGVTKILISKPGGQEKDAVYDADDWARIPEPKRTKLRAMLMHFGADRPGVRWGPYFRWDCNFPQTIPFIRAGGILAGLDGFGTVQNRPTGGPLLCSLIGEPFPWRSDALAACGPDDGTGFDGRELLMPWMMTLEALNQTHLMGRLRPVDPATTELYIVAQTPRQWTDASIAYLRSIGYIPSTYQNTDLARLMGKGVVA